MYFTKKNNSLNPIDNFESNCTDGFSVFKDCPSEIKNQIKKNAQLKSFNRGEKLFNVGDAAAGFFFIQSGTVKISKKGKRNKEFILWLAEHGDFLGLNSLLDDEPFLFSASAVNAVSAYYIPVKDLKSILQKHPAVSVQLMKNICDKLNFIEQRITSISRKKIREQCAEMLISMSVSVSNATGNSEPCINYSIKDLAGIIGTSKNYLYKILWELTGKKIVSIRNRKIFINNLDALSVIAVGNDAET